MAYMPPLQGYVADVPEFWFKRIDGKQFHYTELTNASVTPQVNFTEVQAGWSLYPVAYLPAASTLEMQLTSGQFDTSLFALANGGDFEADSTYKMPVTENLAVTSGIVTLGTTENVTASDVVINGMDRVTGSTPAAGKFAVATTGTEAPYTTTITFNATDFADGDIVEVHYALTKSNAVSLNVTNDRAAIGEAILRWPVYNGGENVSQATFNGASIKGYVLMRVYRCRITAVPGFDTSYKSAAQNSITLSTMDPKYATNANGNAYTLTYIENVA